MPGPQTAAAPRMLAVLGPVEVGQMLYPAMVAWRSWLATWATLWLAPIGLQVRTVELPAEERQDLAGPHR